MKKERTWHHRLIPAIIITYLYFMRRLVLLLVSINADRLLPYHPSFPYATTLLTSFGLPRWLYSAVNFDGVHYITIAEHGYKTVNYVQAFFPFFPLFVIRPLFLLFSDDGQALTLSTFVVKVCFVFSLIGWYELIRHQFTRKIAALAVAFMIVFPTSLFFGALYTESPFMLAMVIALLAAQQKRWWIAGIATLVASATRLVGIFLVPTLMIELWTQYNAGLLPFSLGKLRTFVRQQWKSILWISIGAIGLLTYMVYLSSAFHDPLYFEHVQAAFGAGRESTLVLYPQVLYRALKILITVRPFDLKYYAYVQEFLAGTVGLGLILLAAKKVRASYTFFALCAFFLPTLTGTFSSMPRYILVCFPIYILMASYFVKHPRLSFLWIILSSLWLIFNSLLFVQGYWVA